MIEVTILRAGVSTCLRVLLTALLAASLVFFMENSSIASFVSNAFEYFHHTAVLHYNRGRPHSSLAPGVPEPNQDRVPASDHRHKLPAGYRVVKTSVLGGLHHEYRLVKEAA
jgi:hypothetical protein